MNAVPGLKFFACTPLPAPPQGVNRAPLPVERRELLPEAVAIGILFFAVCHSDLHPARRSSLWAPELK